MRSGYIDIHTSYMYVSRCASIYIYISYWGAAIYFRGFKVFVKRLFAFTTRHSQVCACAQIQRLDQAKSVTSQTCPVARFHILTRILLCEGWTTTVSGLPTDSWLAWLSCNYARSWICFYREDVHSLGEDACTFHHNWSLVAFWTC